MECDGFVDDFPSFIHTLIRECQPIEHNNVTTMKPSLNGNLGCHKVHKRI